MSVQPYSGCWVGLAGSSWSDAVSRPSSAAAELLAGWPSLSGLTTSVLQLRGCIGFRQVADHADIMYR